MAEKPERKVYKLWVEKNCMAKTLLTKTPAARVCNVRLIIIVG